MKQLTRAMAVFPFLILGCDYAVHGTQRVSVNVQHQVHRGKGVPGIRVLCAPCQGSRPRDLAENEYLLRFVSHAATTDEWGNAEIVVPTFTMRGGISALPLKLEDEITDSEFFFGIGDEPMDILRLTMRPGGVVQGEQYLVIVNNIGPPQLFRQCAGRH